MLVTVQYNNQRMQLYTRDCSVEQPANGYKNFLKRKEKTLRLSNAEVSKSQDKKPQTDSQAKLVRITEMTYSSLGIPSGVTSYVAQDYTPNNLRSGLPTYSMTCRQLNSKVQNRK